MVTSCVTIPFPLPPPPSVTTADILQHRRWVYRLRRPPSTLPTATSPPKRCQWRMADPGQQTRDGAHAMYGGMGAGKCKLPHDPITVETAHPRHHSSSLNDANEDPCTQIGERGHWESRLPANEGGTAPMGAVELVSAPTTPLSFTPLLTCRMPPTYHGSPRTANE